MSTCACACACACASPIFRRENPIDSLIPRLCAISAASCNTARRSRVFSWADFLRVSIFSFMLSCSMRSASSILDISARRSLRAFSRKERILSLMFFLFNASAASRRSISSIRCFLVLSRRKRILSLMFFLFNASAVSRRSISSIRCFLVLSRRKRILSLMFFLFNASAVSRRSISSIRCFLVLSRSSWMSPVRFLILASIFAWMLEMISILVACWASEPTLFTISAMRSGSAPSMDREIVGDESSPFFGLGEETERLLLNPSKIAITLLFSSLSGVNISSSPIFSKTDFLGALEDKFRLNIV